jgi:EAL domain-containing protein (putative c-di-GMP-specific phosphodiesterase class I)
MYRAKRGITKVVLHEKSECAVPSSLPPQSLIVELEQAIAKGELVMHYQPKIRLDTKEVVGFEALVRWQHQSRGLLGPNLFVPVLENSPLLAAFTDKTIELALRQSAIWRDRGHDIKIAINISARMLDDPDFVPRFLDQLGQYGIPAQAVALELTETALMVNLAKAQSMVAQLRAHGVTIAIDDFGAGFTSFMYLRDFSVPEIKLDCAFVTELEANSFNASLVRSLSMLCADLGTDFIAEGVERPESWSTLLELGCRLGQGYSIARPMPGEDVLPWLASWCHAREALPAV